MSAGGGGGDGGRNGSSGGAGGAEPTACTLETGAPREVTGARRWLADNLLLMVTLAGIVGGLFLGFGLRSARPGVDAVLLISYPGELFMRLLRLLMVPLVVSSLVSGSASLNARANGRIALRTLLYFLATSVGCAVLGTALATAMRPGQVPQGGPPAPDGPGAPQMAQRAASMLDSLLDLGRNIFPDNLFQATFQQAHTVYVPNKLYVKPSNDSLSTNVMAAEAMIRQVAYRSGTNTVGIVCFCLIFGTLLGTMGEKSKVVIDFFSVVFECIMGMVQGVMWLTPIGISSVIAGKILSVDDLALVLSQLAWFIVTVILGVYIYQLVIMQLIYFFFIRKNPYKFYLGLVQGMLTAFATASTAAALPITFRCMNDKLKIDPRITRFVLPIGCNINMDGTALFVAIASIFIAQMNGIQLSFGELVTVCFTSTAASCSSASVPSAALVLLLMVLSAIDTPTQDVSLLFAVDWIVDRFRTTNNMLGDCYAAAVVEHLSKKELMACDAAAYQDPTSLDYQQTNVNEKSPMRELNSVAVDMHHNGVSNGIAKT